MLKTNQIEDIKSVDKVMLVTASTSGSPRGVYVIPSEITKDMIILSCIQMQKSIANIKANNKVFINAFLPEKDDLQYKITGLAYIEDDTADFKRIKHYEESENLPPELKVNSIVKVKITSVETSNG